MAASLIRKHKSGLGDIPGIPDPEPSAGDPALDPSCLGVRKVSTPNDIRMLMRRVPHSVAVVTSNMSPQHLPDGFHGMTVSSFNTVCLEPKVVVSFNVKRPSATYDAIHASGRFDVHLINSTAEGANVAELFAAGRGMEVFRNDTPRDDDEETVSSTPSTPDRESGVPARLLRATDAIFTLQCKMRETVKVADHVIVLGEVLTHRIPRVMSVWERSSLGMCYVNRKYRRPGTIQTLPGQRVPDHATDSAPGDGEWPPSRASSPEVEPAPEIEVVPMYY